MSGNEIAKSAAELTPPAVVVAAMKVFGLTLPDWVAIAALVYTVLQIVHLLWRWRRAAVREGQGG